MKPLFNIRKTRSWEEVDYLNETKWIRIQFFSENLFYIKFSLALSWLWLALAGSGWFWVILAWLLPALGDFGSLWLALTSSGVIHRLVIPTLNKHLWNLLRFSFRKNNFFLQEKPEVETISVTITDVSEMRCLDLYLINIFTKSTEAERCTDITFKLTLYCLSIIIEDLNL